MLGYDMGGLLGYYSLINLLGSVYSNSPLNAKFSLTKEQSQTVASYLVYGLVNYHYGGRIVQASELDYIWSYQNEYTQWRAKQPLLEGGVDWKSTDSKLFDTDNSLFTETAILDDYHEMNTGIKDIDEVRRIAKVFNSPKVKNKMIVYRNTKSDFVSSYYYEPFDLKVSGC
jgi:hypothetical protein